MRFLQQSRFNYYIVTEFFEAACDPIAFCSGFNQDARLWSRAEQTAKLFAVSLDMMFYEFTV